MLELERNFLLLSETLEFLLHQQYLNVQGTGVALLGSAELLGVGLVLVQVGIVVAPEIVLRDKVAVVFVDLKRFVLGLAMGLEVLRNFRHHFGVLHFLAGQLVFLDSFLVEVSVLRVAVFSLERKLVDFWGERFGVQLADLVDLPIRVVELVGGLFRGRGSKFSEERFDVVLVGLVGKQSFLHEFLPFEGPVV